MKRILLILSIFAIVCGCVGPSGNDTTTTTNTNTNLGLPGIGAADWCPIGQYYNGAGTTGPVQVKIVEKTTMDGYEVCKGVFEGDANTPKVEFYWNPEKKVTIQYIYDETGEFQGKTVTDGIANTIKMYGADGELMYSSGM